MKKQKKPFKNAFTITQPCLPGNSKITVGNFISTYEIAINIIHHAEETQKNFCKQDAHRAKMTLYSIFEQTLKMQGHDLPIPTLDKIISYDGSQRYEGDDDPVH
jgi:hypothetical protein